MRLKRIIVLFVAAIISMSAFAHNTPDNMGYEIVTDYVKANIQSDVSDALQKIIDENPNRTIYFPDGVYVISKPIVTPADPTKSVALQLSNFAVIKAAEGWSHDEAMIRLGGKDAANNIRLAGSNYYLDGGVVDGSGVAKGVSIDGGRETVIRNTSIKNVVMGIHIKHGANSGSSDSDIVSVNIVGNNSPESIGVLVEGYDNTFTNMRIGGVHVGFKILSQANSLRNIHPLYYGSNDSYHTSCGFLDEAGNNWYDFCYSDEFATAFRITKSRRSLYNSCFAYWYSKRGVKHIIFKADGQFNSDVMNMHAGHRQHNATTENKILEVDQDGGTGQFFNLHIDDEKVVTDTSHVKYMK